MDKYLLAIDAGTGSIRSVLFDTNGKQIAISQREWHHLSEEGVCNSMGFDTTRNWELVCECLHEVVSKASIDAKEIVALSATSMREGIVVYDKNKQELWGVANVDARAFEEVSFLQNSFDGIEKRFYEKSGQTFALGALPRLLWLKNNCPKIYDEIAYISMIGDWILARLSGVIASDPSNAGTTGIFNLQTRNWESSMAKEVGIKENIFPPVFEVGSVIGNVTQEASLQTGLSTNTQVVMGGGDVQLGSAGLGVIREGDVAILGGSFWQQVVNIKSTTPPPDDMSLRVNPHVVKGLSQAEGITFFSGLVMRWFRDALCTYEKQEAQKLGIDVYEYLEQKAQGVPVGSYDILPIFSDVMKYGKWYHAAPSFLNLGLDEKKYNIASMFRSLEENAAVVASINLENVQQYADIEIDEIVFAGGASKGCLWSQIVADVTGKTVKVPEVTEATALGAAMAAGIGAGVYSDFEDAVKQLVRWKYFYEPNLKHTKIYENLKIKWQKAYEVQLKLVDDNITTSMWKAPGL